MIKLDCNYFWLEIVQSLELCRVHRSAISSLGVHRPTKPPANRVGRGREISIYTRIFFFLSCLVPAKTLVHRTPKSRVRRSAAKSLVHRTPKSLVRRTTAKSLVHRTTKSLVPRTTSSHGGYPGPVGISPRTEFRTCIVQTCIWRLPCKSVNTLLDKYISTLYRTIEFN